MTVGTSWRHGRVLGVLGVPSLLLRLLLLFLLLFPSGSSAQESATLPPLDPAYQDLALLERRGLVPRGLPALRPLSHGRLAWVLREARSRFENDSPAGRPRVDLEAVLSRLEHRFGASRANSATGLAEIEIGGGRSPGRGVPTNGFGAELDIALNPLWSNRGGRAYGDERTGALALRASAPLGPYLAIGLAGRSVALQASGARAGRRDAALEAAYLRAVLGRIAIQIGRDSWWQQPGGDDALLMSRDAPPVDLLRIVTDRPLSLRVLGDTEFAVTVADLGPNQNFPHAKLFGVSLMTRPASSVRLGLTLLNKQTGEGAPGASFSERLKDLSFFWDLFRKGRDFVFSEKLLGLDARVVLPDISGIELFGEIAFTDFATDRLGDVLTSDTGYRVGVHFPRLGKSERHSVEVEGALTAPLLYRHHQFTTGVAVDGFSQGSVLGPDGRRLIASYRYDAPASRWAALVTGALESRSVDPHETVYNPVKDIFRAGTLPHEWRARARVDVTRWFDQVSGMELALGVERVRNFAFEADASRTNTFALVRVRRTF